jgi:hypothetical protein
MTGGTIKMNNIVATQSYGGGVAVGVNGTFNMGGNAIITLNRGLGGGVYLINGASTALNMYGNAKIVSNTSSTPGSIGGVHMDRNFTGIISVQDNAQILHNVKIPQNSSSSYAYTYTDAFTVTDTDVSLIGDEEANLYLENGSGAKITVSGKLTLLHSISLSFRNSSVDTVITTDYSTYNNTTTSSGNKQPAKYFIFDQEDTVDHKVISLVNGEAVITLPTVRLDYTDTTSHSTYYGDFVLAVDDYNLGTLSNRVLTLLANSPVTSHAYLKQSGTLNLNDKLLYAEGENTLFTLTVFGANLDVTVKDEFTTDATAKYYVTDETTGMYKFFKDDGTLYTADDTETYITGGGIVAGKSGFLTNRHRYGAGLFVYNANVTLEGGTIAGNYVGLSAGASNSWGGGVGVINNGTFTMNGGSIEGNYSTNGGGIYVASGTTFTMNGGSIKNNKTFGGNGGGVYLNGGVFNMNGGTIAGNTAAVNGGGIFVNSGNLTIVAGTIDSNKAVKGAGVYINAGTQQIGSAIVTTQANDAQPSTYSVTISNNSYAANGSGIYFKGTKLTLSNVEISNNASSADGAGIYAESGEVQITKGQHNFNQRRCRHLCRCG